MKIIALVAVIVTLPNAAAAAPTFLSCTLDQGEPIKVDVIVDEKSRSVTTVSDKTGEVDSVAQFSAKKVIWEEEFGVGALRYEIDRVTLGVTRHFVSSFGGKGPMNGKCQLGKAPKRAF